MTDTHTRTHICKWLHRHTHTNTYRTNVVSESRASSNRKSLVCGGKRLMKRMLCARVLKHGELLMDSRP